MANPADSSRLGEIIANLLITDLTESPYLKVVSSQRLYDILKLLGKEGVKRVDKAVATQVAEKAQAKWMLLGSILQVEPRMVITTQLVEVKNGEVKKSQHIAGEPKEDVFSLVDKLTAALKKDLSLPAQAEKEETPKVADVTTHSQEAYRFYVEGMDYTNKYYWTEAEKSFKKALEYDSTFAMAYFRLSILAYYTGNPVRKGLSARAMKYSDKVSQKEKLYIQALEAGTLGNDAQFIKVMQKIVERYPDEKEAFLWLGQAHRGLRKFDESIHYLSKAIELDSLYKEAYNILAYAFDESGDFEKSIWAINRYIELAPDEPNPYDSRADLYAWNGKIDLAVESYKKAIEMEPDFYMSISKLGNMYLFKRDYAKAESCYEKLCASSDAGIRAEGRLYLAYIPAYQGRFDNALKVLDDGLVADRMDKIDGWQDAEKHFVKSRIYQERKNSAMALQEIEKYMEIYRRVYLDNKLYGRQYYARLLAENKEFAKAEEVAQAVKKDVGDKDPSYWLMIGNIELERGNLEASIAYLEKAATAGAAIGRHFSLAQAYLQAGRLDESVAEFEKVLTRYDEYRASSAVYNVKTYYLLGLAYEKSGWNKKAIEKYEEFLDIWKNADPGILEVTDAKERLRKLKANSRQ
jgi:tetratricopeptide (TPR) repeat protein